MTRFLLSAALLAISSATCLAAGAQKPIDPGSPPVRAFGKLVYVFTGALDDAGAALAGVATTVTCTNIGPGATRFEFISQNFDRVVKDNFLSSALAPGGTYTYSTHATTVYAEDHSALPGKLLDQGSISVRSLTVNVVCTATVEDAASATPNGWELHGIRYNPAPGTQE